MGKLPPVNEEFGWTKVPKNRSGSRVGIIGGGPAGSLFALYLLHYAGEKGIHPKVTIYNLRNFDEPGS